MSGRRQFTRDITMYSASTILFSTMLSACKSSKLMVQDSTSGAYKFVHIRDGVGYFTERGGTIGWSVAKDGISVIDTQFADQASHLLLELAKYRSTPIDVLINTHHHGDHTGGNIVFKDKVVAHLAHQNAIVNLKRNAAAQNNMDKQLIPTQSFTDTKKVSVGKKDIMMHYFGQGHTNGDAIIQYVKEDIVHVGDLVFNRRFPYIDKSAGANIKSWISVLDKITSTFGNKTSYIFGHAADGYEILGSAEDIKAFKNYLERLLEYGTTAVKAGKTLEQIKLETTMIPGADQWKGDGISRSLEAVYQEVTTGI